MKLQLLFEVEDRVMAPDEDEVRQNLLRHKAETNRKALSEDADEDPREQSHSFTMDTFFLISC